MTDFAIKTIDKDMIIAGLKAGIIRLIDSPNYDGTVCSIGDNWFYFGGYEAEGISAKEYRQNVPEEDIVNEILSALNEFKGEAIFKDRYLYYYTYLFERLMTEIEKNKVTLKKNSFETNEECALALFLYLKTVGKIEGTEYDRETILHDINNLRGCEWLQHIERNEETEQFFSYLKLEEDRVDPRLATLIEKVAQEVVAQYDWTMPKYNSDEYEDYDNYESDCLDIGHERRGEICRVVIKRLVEDGEIPESDESYYEVIDETVWDEITTYICRNQDTEEENVMQKVWRSPYFAPDSYFLYINNSENKSVSVSKSGNCYVLRGTKPDDYELFEGNGNHPINLGLICEITLEEALSKAEAIYIRELKELINKKKSLLEVLENGEREIIDEKRENL